MALEEAMNTIHVSMLRVVALALDAAVEHPNLDIDEDLYEELLMEATIRMQATVGAYLPAYPKALERVASVCVKTKVEQSTP